jgi:hypothetical protein
MESIEKHYTDVEQRKQPLLIFIHLLKKIQT